MPEYLAPGVYVEEVSFRSKSIEGVSTTTSGFIGPTAYGPTNSDLEIITSLEEFERIYGSGEKLVFTDATGSSSQEMDNFMWHGLRAFFAEGGTRAYVARVFLPRTDEDGRAKKGIKVGDVDDGIMVSARFPGAAGQMRVRFTLRLGPNILGKELVNPSIPNIYRPLLGTLTDKDIVWIDDESSPPNSPLQGGDFYRANRLFDPVIKDYKWTFTNSNGTITAESLIADPTITNSLRAVNLTVTVIPTSEVGIPQTWEVALDPEHIRNGATDSLFEYFAEEPANRSQALSIPIVITPKESADVDSGIKVLNALFAADTEGDLLANLLGPLLPLSPVAPVMPRRETSDLERSLELVLDIEATMDSAQVRLSMKGKWIRTQIRRRG